MALSLPFPTLKQKTELTPKRSDELNQRPALLPETEFLRALCGERKRTERSGRPFLLFLFDGGRVFEKGEVAPKIAAALAESTRDTDVTGWYKDHAIMAALCTEIADVATAEQVLFVKMAEAIASRVSSKVAEKISISVHCFPDVEGSHNGETDFILYPDLAHRAKAKKPGRVLKRATDVVGSLTGLVLCVPFLLLIALAIKLTSEGPVLFKQRRVGQYGREFEFLKFRSMYVNNDANLHKEYVTKFIAGNQDIANRDDKCVYKIKNDPRVTPVGRLLRRTSLDELPQFLNVLRGDMSLVGPRPPVPYEAERYKSWHRRRILEAKPGITGLWQVTGRSRLSFDEMVRLDLEYCQKASLALDLRILLQTPAAVLSGDGAC